jgi:hypothetical protein
MCALMMNRPTSNNVTVIGFCFMGFKGRTTLVVWWVTLITQAHTPTWTRLTACLCLVVAVAEGIKSIQNFSRCGA